MQEKEQEVYFALQGKHIDYNMLLTKKTFFWNEHQKKILTRAFLVDPAG